MDPRIHRRRVEVRREEGRRRLRVLVGITGVVAVGGAILLTWPAVPWAAIRIGAIALMLAAPFLLYPMSRLMWLAFDLIFRPGHESHLR